MNEKKAYEALSSSSRLRILKLLHRKSLNVDEIAESVNLQPITVRHHLQLLEDAGFVESREERTGTVGRPKVYYEIAEKPNLVGYPPRRYLTLATHIMEKLQSLIGPKKAKEFFRSVGNAMGESAVKEIESKHGVREWSCETFRDFFIARYLEDAGTEPEILKAEKNRVTYRVHNCLFLELALEMPEIMCDVLHEAFHEGVTSAMGKRAEITRTTCQGHGDTYCEHLCEWRAPSE